MKIRLVEVDYTIHVPIAGTHDWHQIVIHAGLLDGKLNLSFTISGTDERENLPASLVDAIREGLAYAQKSVNVKDLSEKDSPESDE